MLSWQSVVRYVAQDNIIFISSLYKKATAVVYADSRLIRLFIVLLHDVSREHFIKDCLEQAPMSH